MEKREPATSLVGIPAHNLADVWHMLSGMVGECCVRSGGKYEPSDILRLIVRGEMQLWAAVGPAKIEAIAIGQIINYPRIKQYRILGTTGEDRDHWVEHIHGIENWARLQGCQDFEAITRPGWARILKNEGFRHTHSILGKNLMVEGTLQ